MMETYNENLSLQVGRFCSATDDLLASCFPVSPNVIVTCYHAISNCDLENCFNVYWPKLSLSRKAHVIKDSCSPEDDVVFLSLDSTLPMQLQQIPLGVRHTYNGEFISFGYRKAAHYNGLYANGQLVGEVRAVDGRLLLQLDSNTIDKGMSGAPILDATHGTIVGMVSEYWATKNAPDSTLAFAVPMSRLMVVRPSLTDYIPEVVAAPKFIATGKLKSSELSGDYKVTKDDLIFACTRLALLLAADQYEDGAWGRSLWKETGVEDGIKITTDVADVNYVMHTHTKKALSVTTWAAQALSKVCGTTYIPSVRQAMKFAIEHQDKDTFAFGNIYVTSGGTPFAKKDAFIRSPRHTASGIKLLELTQGISLEVVKGFEFIIKHQSSEGGWGESTGDAPNTLATAYVLDALIKIMQVPGFKNMLSPDIARSAWPSIMRGMSWLIQNRDVDNLWSYSGNSAFKPMFSANILALIPQLTDVFHDDTSEALEALLKLGKNGGIPARLKGKPDITSTAMCLYAMLRIDPERYHREIQKSVNWLVKRLKSDEWLENYGCMQGVFGLLSLGLLPELPRTKLNQNLNEMFSNEILDVNGIPTEPSYWLSLDQKLNLGIGDAIRGMYL